MANTKISALTSSTTPLAGTEVLPIVQSGATVKVATDDLTVKNIRANATTGILQVTGPAAASTRVMTTPNANFTVARTDAAQSFTGDQTLSTGNLVIGTSGKGIDFTATPGTGTSELLADYEEGTWTPALTLSGGSVTYTSRTGTYTKIGRLVTVQLKIVVNVATTPSGTLEITGLPFTVAATSKGSTSALQLDAWSATLTGTLVGAATPSTTNIRMYELSTGSLANPGAKVASGCDTQLTLSYEV
jgi:hypothetical protein